MMSADVNKGLEVEFSPDFETNLGADFRLVLPMQTAEKLLASDLKIERLKRDFNLPDFDSAQVTGFVERVFSSYIDFRREHALDRETSPNFDNEALYKDRRHQDLILLLGIAGTLTPILEGDWEIDRQQSVETNFGIRDFVELQKILALEKQEHSPDAFETDSYGGMKHLDKGAGNAVFLQNLRDRSDHETSREWREIGMGFALHHAPTDILTQFLKSDLDLSTLAFAREVILPNLRSALQREWFNKVGEDWQAKEGEIFDNNDIYRILLNPAQWLEAEKSVVETSTEFENDTKTHITPEAYATGLRYLGIWTDQQIEYKRLIFSEGYIKFLVSKDCPDSQRISQDEFQRRRREIRSERDKLPRVDHRPQVFRENKELEAIRAGLQDVNKRLNSKPRPDSTELKALKTRARELGEELKDKRVEVLEAYESKFTSLQMRALEKMFKADFILALQSYIQSGTPGINLNRHAKANPHNFVSGAFLDLPDHFEGELFDLITSLRATSHESDPEFEKDFLQTFRALEPGGFILDDGFKQSYSRVMRLHHLNKAVDEARREGLEITSYVIMDAETHKPKAVCFQRAHTDGTSTLADSDSLLRSTFTEDVYLKPLADFSGSDLDPIATQVELLNWGRRIALRLTKSGKDKHILNGQHEAIKQQVAAILPNLEGMSLDEIDLLEHLGHQQLAELQQIVMDKVAQLMSESHKKVGEIVQLPNGRFEIYAGGKLDTYVDLSQPLEGRINRFSSLRFTNIPTMGHFEQPEVIEAKERKKERLKKLLAGLKAYGMDSPLVVVNFKDCVTNEILWERLQELVGTNFAQEARIDFASDDDSQAQQKLARFIETGGVLAAGGSWGNVDEKEGPRIKKLFAPVLTELLRPNSAHTALGICFSYQVLADLIGERISPSVSNSVEVRSGMFEFGAIPVAKGARMHDSDLYRDCPKNFALAHTHGRHLVDHRAGESFSGSADLLSPSATSLLTKQPVGFITRLPGILGRGYIPSIVGFQGHPEVRLNTKADTDRVKKQLEVYGPYLKENFGIGVQTLCKGFDEYAERSEALGHQEESGDHLILNALTMLTEGVYKKMRKPLPA